MWPPADLGFLLLDDATDRPGLGVLFTVNVRFRARDDDDCEYQALLAAADRA